MKPIFRRAVAVRRNTYLKVKKNGENSKKNCIHITQNTVKMSLAEKYNIFRGGRNPCTYFNMKVESPVCKRHENYL